MPKSAEEILDEIFLLVQGNGLSMNDAKARSLVILKQWKTTREENLHYQLISLKSNHTENTALVKAVKDAINSA